MHRWENVATGTTVLERLGRKRKGYFYRARHSHKAIARQNRTLFEAMKAIKALAKMRDRRLRFA